MTLNDVINKIAAELTLEHDKEFGHGVSTTYVDNNMARYYNNEEHDRTMRREGYEKAMEVIRRTLYKIVSEEIKSKNLDFIL